MQTPTLLSDCLSVLVVDDMAAAREHMADLVRTMGYRCQTASSGQEALQCIDSAAPDIVLLDLLMPDTDGFEISRRIRERVTQKWLPVIVVSSLDGDQHFIHALSMGAADYLVKPVRPALLMAKLQHYQSVLALQAKAAALARMKDDFLATVSHELRTPITSVLGAMGLLVAGAAGPLPAPAMELAQVAKRNSERLSRLIDDVLDLTKLENNRMVLNIHPHCLNILLQEAAEANSAYGQRLGVPIALKLPPRMAYGVVDGDRFLQVMANLLSNAIKHSPKGQAVELRLVDATEQWRIEVADMGRGIDPAFQQRLFEKFSQADGADQGRIGGTGLGLYISRMLVERMGGQIAVRSESGKGSVFTVLLDKGAQHG